MIDFHCHLDLYQDCAGVLSEAVRRRCLVLAVTTTPLAWNGTSQLIGKAKGVHIALGLHPELVATRAREVDQFCQLVQQAQFVGEIGLDGSPPHRASLSEQLGVFRTILTATASAGGRVMSIHSRGATTDVLMELERRREAGTAVLHWFTGTIKELQRAIEFGCWFSVGPAMLRTEKGRLLAARMPPERVLTETDGPFARNGHSPLFPWDAAEAEVLLSTIWGIDRHETERRLRGNLRSLLAETSHDKPNHR